MVFTELKLKGAYLIELESRADERGFFSRYFCKKEFEQHGLCTSFVQSSISFNYTKGTIRGMHYQEPPFAEVKLVRCTKGSIYDVIVDLRDSSDTYMKWVGVELSETNRRILYIPVAMAHGFQTLLDNTEVEYHISEYYHPEVAKGISWDDERCGITWPLPCTCISSRDNARGNAQ